MGYRGDLDSDLERAARHAFQLRTETIEEIEEEEAKAELFLDDASGQSFRQGSWHILFVAHKLDECARIFGLIVANAYRDVGVRSSEPDSTVI
jgi:hypothetical protein